MFLGFPSVLRNEEVESSILFRSTKTKPGANAPGFSLCSDRERASGIRRCEVWIDRTSRTRYKSNRCHTVRSRILFIASRILMLAACLPLLQPSGFCICKAAVDTSLSTYRVEQSLAKETPKPRKSCCCKHLHDGDALAPAIPTVPTSPGPDDDSHSPGCPASSGIDRLNWVEPLAAFDSVASPIDVLSIVSIQTTSTLPCTVDANGRWPASPPLFLLNCSLVI